MLQLPKIRFKLNDSFIEQFVSKEPAWGPLGLITYKRSYARGLSGCGERIESLGNQYGLKDAEEFWLTCVRVIEGIYNIQKAHCENLKLPWNNSKAQISAQDMYQRMWDFKWSPPGRGLWMMGVDHLWSLGSMALKNCSFISSEELKDNLSEPFCYMMDASMLGVGVGFDTKGAGSVSIRSPKLGQQTVLIEDSRQGWVDSLRVLLDSFTGKKVLPSKFDYSLVRLKGALIKGFGGISSGPEPLVELHADIYKLLTGTDVILTKDPLCLEFPQTNFEPFAITSTQIVDVFNLIGRCVVSGNVRRSSQIGLGDPKDMEFQALKQDKKLLEHHRWAANLSVFSTIGMDYTGLAESTAVNGEPGYYYLDNVRKYGRTSDPPNYKDKRVMGVNPCFAKDALILTNEGLRKAEEIQVGSIAWTGSTWSTVVQKTSSGIQDVYLYETPYGRFKGTQNHSVSSEGQKKQIKDVTLLDVTPGLTDSHLPFEKTSFDLYKEAVAFGLALTIGSKNEHGFYIKEKNTADLALEELKQENILSLLKINLIEHDKIPEKHSDRIIPQKYMEASLLKVSALLTGVFAGRASGSRVNETISVTVYNQELAKQIQTLLSAIGIPAFLAEGVYHSQTKYRVCIENRHLPLLSKRINTKLNTQLHKKITYLLGRKVEDIATRISTAITNTTFIGQEEVFDITVEHVSHQLWTSGLLVYNCGEIGLESYETCNLSELYPANHESLEDFLKTAKLAYLYSKSVTLLPSHNERVNQIEMRNRRIGLSQSGIVQSINKHGFREHMQWCDVTYQYIETLDEQYSEWLCIPKSIKKTTVKPSGSISLLCGATPGIHYPIAEYYIRNIRFSDISPIVKACRKAGYKVEKDTYTPDTMVVSFPIHEKHFQKAEKDISIWEQMELNAQIQAYWADNCVSHTVKLQIHELHLIAQALSYYETRIKGISFLPAEDHGYVQAPYIAISKEEYESLIEKIKPLNLKDTEHEITEKFCDGDSCILDFSVPLTE